MPILLSAGGYVCFGRSEPLKQRGPQRKTASNAKTSLQKGFTTLEFFMSPVMISMTEARQIDIADGGHCCFPGKTRENLVVGHGS
jgi:hypothetical protein